jgi:hypothetical protein
MEEYSLVVYDEAQLLSEKRRSVGTGEKDGRKIIKDRKGKRPNQQSHLFLPASQPAFLDLLKICYQLTDNLKSGKIDRGLDHPSVVVPGEPLGSYRTGRGRLLSLGKSIYQKV